MLDLLCTSCGQSFSSGQSLAFHKNVCIYYQYHILYGSITGEYVSNDYIKQIIKLYMLLELYKLDSIKEQDNYDNIPISFILSKTNNNIMYINVYNTISQINSEYISCNELISVLSKLLHISTNTFCNIIDTYNVCCSYFSM